jgi:hypothetical protein
MRTSGQVDLRTIVSIFFVESRDFNGIPGGTLMQRLGVDKDASLRLLKEAVRGGDVTVVSPADFVNPHVKPWEVPVERQIAALDAGLLEQSCVYPSEAQIRAVMDATQYDDRPFTKRLALGKGQLEPFYFDLAILETYSTDPRYRFVWSDYNGSIGLTEEHHRSGEVEPGDDSFLQTFGLGYDDRGQRVVVVHLRYLHGLSPEHQQIWNAKLIKRPCKMVYEYYQNGILAEWAEDMSFYTAVLLEMRVINEIAEAVGRAKLFRNTFEEERPREFSIFFRPTLRNYEAFVHVLDKMLSENIDKAFFRGDVEDEERITRKDGSIEVRQRGTLTMLDDWLRTRWQVNDPDYPGVIMDVLREVRNFRRQPAHKIVPNEYDKQYAEKQDDLVARVYRSLRTLRLLLQNYPEAKTVNVPDDLQKGRIKHF